MVRFLNFTKRKWLIHFSATHWLTGFIVLIDSCQSTARLFWYSSCEGCQSMCEILKDIDQEGPHRCMRSIGIQGLPCGERHSPWLLLLQGRWWSWYGNVLGLWITHVTAGTLLSRCSGLYRWYNLFELFFTRKQKKAKFCLLALISWVFTHFRPQIWSLFQLSRRT